jgi:Ca2+:H+ antiporter
MVRRILFASVGLAPVVILIHYVFHPTETLEFVLAAAALIPLAWLIGEATEHAAEHTGPGIGGFLNATFGNAPELIIALFAVSAMEYEVVRGSLTGSVVGNLLLVLGFSLLFGGRGEIDKPSSFLSLGLVAATTLLLLITSIPGWNGDPERDSLVTLSIPVAIVLLVAYVILTWYSLRRHAALHIASDEEIKGWSLRLALLVLGLATVVTALVAEILVGSINTFADDSGISEFFLAAVVIAIVGNAAEHGGAVVVAARGKIKLAAEIALSSSAQVAVFLIPAVALLALLIEPLALSFREVEILALGASVVVASILLADGRSSRLKGVIMIVTYVCIAAAFFFAGER